MHTKRAAIWLGVSLALAAGLLVGCASLAERTAEPAMLAFDVGLAQTPSGRIMIEAIVSNTGDSALVETAPFSATMELQDEQGRSLARLEAPQLNGELSPGETQIIASTERPLEPGLYRVIWGADTYGGTLLDFTVLERDGVLELGEGWVQVTPAPSETPSLADDGEKTADTLVALAATDVALRMGVRASQVQVTRVEAIEFPDASLGIPEEGMVYAQVVTPGYAITLQVGGQTYVYHGAGERVVQVDGAEPGVADDESVKTEETSTVQPILDAAAEGLVRKARADLAERSGLAVNAVRVAKVEATEFRDASLGVPEEGMMYAQVITPGYTITLEAASETIVYHAAGERVVQVPR
ncbi:MAG: hypothetical protein ACYC4R_02565 [Anaerolineae bacterium]